MKEIYLHIGLPRTGTTYLQQIIFPQFNLHYQSRLHHSTWNIENCKNLFSNENICGKPYEISKLDRLGYFAYFSSLKPQPKIIVCIREIESLYKSMYTIFVKAGFSGTYNEALEILKVKYNLSEIREEIYKYFSDVYVYSFEEFCKNRQQTIDNLCDYLDEPHVDAPKIKLNVAWTPRQLKLCKFLNKVNAQHGKFSKEQGIFNNKYIIELLQENGTIKGVIKNKKKQTAN